MNAFGINIKKQLSISLILIMIFLFSTLSAQQILTVKQDGSGDFITIQGAIDSSQDGDTVLVWPGVYFENLEINSRSIILNPRIWNWISFPRLQRTGNNTYPSIDLLKDINPFPSYLQMIHLDPENQIPFNKTYFQVTNTWTGTLDEVKSSLGYKLETNNTCISFLPMSGTILAPETTFPLFDLRPNWTGYYLTEPQSPFDAIASEFQDKIDWIQGQYWYCHKEINHTKNSGYWWRCACSQGRIELKYGDMVVIHPTEHIPDFHWQNAGPKLPDDPKNPPQLFQYQEQAEYDAIFIQLDSMNMPEEIGAFAGDSCIGATTVLPNDTTVLICGYTQGYEGQEITFNLIYPAKSSGPANDDYYVMNKQTGISEKRRIVAGEKQPYFLVSFKGNSGNLHAEESSWLKCRPNPVINEVTVSYFMNEDAVICFRLTNAMGSVVKSWNRGYQRAGSFEFSFSTAGFPPGCYQLQMNTGNNTTMQKLIFLN